MLKRVVVLIRLWGNFMETLMVVILGVWVIGIVTKYTYESVVIWQKEREVLQQEIVELRKRVKALETIVHAAVTKQ